MTDEKLTTFADLKPLLHSIAYRMLGSVMDAEDIVQEAFVRWQEADDAGVRSPRAYLATVVTRLCINQLQSARTRREVYVGPWLPEPLVTDPTPSAAEHVELGESLSMAFLILLERLSPTERAVFLLREVFDFDYSEIGRIIEKNEANCRQVFTRAKKAIAAERTRFPVGSPQSERLVREFSKAARAGDMQGLLDVLAEDITVWSDGGGKVAAALKPIHGPDHVAAFVLGAMRKFVPAGSVVCPSTINGQAGFLSYVEGRPFAALVFDVVGERIQTVYIVSNPDKLRCVPPPPEAITPWP